MKKITAIQYWEHIQLETDDQYGCVSYWGNIAIDDQFMIQFYGDNEGSRYSMPISKEAFWREPAKQDAAKERYTLDDVIDFVENEGFENNYYYIMENGEQMDKAPASHVN